MHSALCPGDGHAPQAGALRAAAAAILRATHLLVAAGAGMSADSGLATYDAIADVRCYHDRGLSYADLCCPRLLETDPALAYGFWGSCLHSYRAAAPHAGYALVRRWCEGREWYVYTYNVDGLFARAGFDEARVCEMHGRCERWLPRDGSGGGAVLIAPSHAIAVDPHSRLLQGLPSPPAHAACSDGSAAAAAAACSGAEQLASALGAAGVPLDSLRRPMRPAVSPISPPPRARTAACASQLSD